MSQMEREAEEDPTLEMFLKDIEKIKSYFHLNFDKI